MRPPLPVSVTALRSGACTPISNEVMARILHAGDAFGAFEILRGGVAALLALAGVIDQEFGDFAERAAFLAIVDNDAQTAGLPGARAFRRHLAGAAAAPHAGAEYLAAALALVADGVLDSDRQLAHIAA